MDSLLGDDHLSELERLDKPCATRESNLQSSDLHASVKDAIHSALPSPNEI